MKRCSLLLVSLAAMVMLTACSHDPNVLKQKSFQTGQSYFSKGNYREAAIAFLNATKIDPNFTEAHYQLAQSCLKVQDWGCAYQELRRTIEQQPQNYQAHIDLANFLVVAGKFDQAKEQTDLLIKALPNDPKVHITISNLLAAQSNLPGAIDEANKAIALDPSRWEPYLDLAVLQMKTGQDGAAEQNLRKVVELNPKSIQAQLLLGTYYQAHGKLSDAEQQFRNAMASDPSSPDPVAALARLMAIQGKSADAEALLKQAKTNFPNNSAGYRMLGDFYLASGDLDKAAAEFASLTKEHSNDTAVKKTYIRVLLQKGSFAEARSLDDEILKATPADNEALVYRGEIQVSTGHPQDAVNTLQAVIRNDSNNGDAHYALGLAFEKLGEAARAENEWRMALQQHPDLVDAQRAMAALAMRNGDMTGLEQASSEIVRLQPTAPDGHALRAMSNINRARFPQAEQDIRTAIQVAPQSAYGYVQLGNLRLAQKRYREADQAYQQALDRKPDSSDAMNGLVSSKIAQNQPDSAVTAINAQIAKSPNNSAFYDLLGNVLLQSKNDLNGAEAAFKKAIDLDASNFDALLKLGRVEAVKGTVDDAIAVYQHSLAQNPQQPGLLVLMGELYEARQDWSHATTSYQKALELKHEDPMASNNLARVMVESQGNLDIALSLAQTARRGMPDSGNTADTLARVYFARGDYRPAIDLFREALRLNERDKRPDNPRLHYFLGMAYVKTGQSSLARTQLQQVLRINPNYRDADEVRKQLAQLKS